jgi:hypothetical protein
MRVKTPVVLGCSLLGALIVIGACNASTPEGSAHRSSLPSGPTIGGSAIGDVVLTQCTGTYEGSPYLGKVTVKVTNPTDRVQSYMITVSMNDTSGTRLEEANGASNSVMPGQTAKADLLATGVEGVAGCTVANVVRIPA